MSEVLLGDAPASRPKSPALGEARTGRLFSHSEKRKAHCAFIRTVRSFPYHRALFSRTRCEKRISFLEKNVLYTRFSHLQLRDRNILMAMSKTSWDKFLSIVKVNMWEHVYTTIPKRILEAQQKAEKLRIEAELARKRQKKKAYRQRKAAKKAVAGNSRVESNLDSFDAFGDGEVVTGKTHTTSVSNIDSTNWEVQFAERFSREIFELDEDFCTDVYTCLQKARSCLKRVIPEFFEQLHDEDSRLPHVDDGDQVYIDFAKALGTRIDGFDDEDTLVSDIVEEISTGGINGYSYICEMQISASTACCIALHTAIHYIYGCGDWNPLGQKLLRLLLNAAPGDWPLRIFDPYLDEDFTLYEAIASTRIDQIRTSYRLMVDRLNNEA